MGTILVTGANRGIGLEFACQYAEADEQVIATCRNLDEATALKHLSESHPNVRIEKLDVSDAGSISDLAKRLIERGEKLDILINNAGMLVDENWGSWSATAFSKTLATNVIGPALVIQELTPLLSKGSRVINISSGLGSLNLKMNLGANTGTYAVSKAALNMVTAQAAAGLKSKGVIVASFNPGWVKTDMGGPEAELEIVDSVSSLRKTFAGLTMERSGEFIDYNGDPYHW